MRITREIAEEYRTMWEAVKIDHSKKAVIAVVAEHLEKSRYRYIKAARPFDMPWEVVAVLHAMEGNGQFSTHLHNGDPLTRRTVNVPSGRPFHGKPPFSWEDSAMDALGMKNTREASPWTVENTLWFLEQWNGLGYRLHHPEVPSPFLWSFTSFYHQGKYISDGRWSGSTISDQPGAVPLLIGLGWKAKSVL